MQFDPSATQLPVRKDLLPIKGAPAGAAWFWGKNDELGRLNLLTPARTAAAAKLIQTGEVVNLDWAAELPNPPVFGREPFQMQLKAVTDSVFDDIYHMNTQSGSQFDGFRHVGHAHEGTHIFYNNLSKDEINHTSRCGMQAWADHGIVGRGVLLDYWSYAGNKYDPTTTHRITLKDLLECAKLEGVDFQYGDILIIRSGFIDAYNNMTSDKRDALGKVAPTAFTFVGVEQTPEMLDFLHDKYFSVVAGDAPAFEAWPTNQDWYCHEYLLALWGVPIGEMWDLERLAKVCRQKGRWTFFFSSSPSNVKAGVGSFPNAYAIF